MLIVKKMLKRKSYTQANLVAHTLAKLEDIPVEVAAIEIMQAINIVTNELSQEENEHE